MAKDANGRLVKAAESNKACQYYCPCCDARLILKKSGMKGKGRKRPHFAHAGDAPPCSPETILHLVAKQRVAEILQAKLSAGVAVPFTWKCPYCAEEHKGNLLRTATAIAVERTVGRIRPDILLSDKTSTPRIAVEIVVSHAPEPEMLAFCKEHAIQVVELHLTSDEDLDRLEILLANPTLVRVCRNPPCTKCNGHQRTKVLVIVHGICWQCKGPILVAGIEGDYGVVGPDQFSEKERQIASEYGVLLRKELIRIHNREFWVNKCQRCPGFIGPGYLDEQYIGPAESGEIPSEKQKIGHYCPICDQREEDDAPDQW